MKITRNMSIGDLQKYAQDITAERGFDDETVEQKFILLVEEVGELAKALRRTSGVKFAADTERTIIEDEIADVQLLLLNIANSLNIEMAEALESKETKNRMRIWK